MRISILVQELRDGCVAEAQAAAGLPAHASYRFDRGTTGSETTERPLIILKTTRRQVVSLRFSRFESQEVVRQERSHEGRVTHHSPQLAAIVPRGGHYAYDLIAHVGVESLLHGRRLQDLAKDLAALEIPFSSLYDLQQKFMFYFGHLHRQSAPRIRDYLRQRGAVTWLIDGTQELGSPVFLGVKAAQDGFLLGSWRIGSENLDDVVPCVAELREAYGPPERVLHDLSDTMSGACDRALPGVTHHVCQFHLLKDIGEDLFQAPQAALSGLVRQLKLQPRMKEQRSGQIQWLAAWTVFQSLRDVLRFSAQGTSPLGDPYRLTATEQRTMFSSLQELRDECRRRSTEDDDPQQRKLCAIVSTHLDRYWDHLPTGDEYYAERTNNGIETYWRQFKRTRRSVHGRCKLTQDFQALPQEYMLIQNLDNPRYVELVLGTLDNLADKLAEAGRTAGSFSEWQRQTQQSSLGRLPKRLLRKENSLCELLGCYDDWQEQVPAKAAG